MIAFLFGIVFVVLIGCICVVAYGVGYDNGRKVTKGKIKTYLKDNVVGWKDEEEINHLWVDSQQEK